MKTRRMFFNRIVSLQLVLVIIVSLFINIIVANEVQAVTYTQTTKTGISEFPESYQGYLKELSELHPDWTFTAFYTGITWDNFMKNESSLGGSSYSHGKNTVIASAATSWLDSCGTVKSGYACASPDIIAYFADPRNFLTESGVFQFLEMSYNSSVHTTAGVKSIIKGTFMENDITVSGEKTEQTNSNTIANNMIANTITVAETKTETKISYADIIMKAAKESGISPYSIAIKIIQEVGRKGSNSVSGTYPGYEGYYNFFNIGAYDSGNAIENGLKYAKEKGWNSQDTAIIEGAKYMSDSYINVGQNTAYYYKFDVIDGKNGTFWHQYMTNIQDPSSQAKILYNTYVTNNLLDIALNFIIPVYDNMPDSNIMPGTIDPKANTSYFVNGTEVNLREKATTDSARVSTLVKNEVVKVIEFNKASANGYDWAYIERSNGTKGYVANKYLTKCNENAETVNGNNNTDTKNCIAMIDKTYIITIPDKTIKEIMKEVSINSYKVTDTNKATIGADKNVATTYTVSDEKANKTYLLAVLGDTNGDGVINSGDLLALKKHLLGTNIIKDESKKIAMDTNRDGTINSGDLLALKKYLLGTKKLEL